MTSMTDREYLEHQAANLDEPELCAPHADKCGFCHKIRIGAKLAKRILAMKELPEGAVRIHSQILKRVWERSKYFKLYQAEIAAGRKPFEAFIRAGWEP